MTLRSRFLSFSLIAGLIGLFVQGAAAQQDPVHVIASNGMKAVIEELQPRIEKSIGHPLSIEYGSTAGLMRKIDAGAGFDAVILTSDAIRQLAKEAKVNADTRVDFARCGVGLAVRSGAPKPDIGTSAAMKKTLQQAPSISYAKDGASRVYIDKMLERLGIAEEMKSKALLTQGSGPAMASVAEGKTAVVMTLISELLPVRGIDVVGPFPAGLQNYVSFGAAVGAKASQPDGAKELIVFLKSPEAAPVYKAKGMERVAGK
ncbi:MAG TPA: substrate-binding domain-containing protein [Bryobacteraceae bacterium]|jgi:molybdate transport system substrate-binding protein|nr:substrate-binding domain-containing protein [Bryobacteraceae bacterium]